MLDWIDYSVVLQISIILLEQNEKGSEGFRSIWPGTIEVLYIHMSSIR